MSLFKSNQSVVALPSHREGVELTPRRALHTRKPGDVARTIDPSEAKFEMRFAARTLARREARVATRVVTRLQTQVKAGDQA